MYIIFANMQESWVLSRHTHFFFGEKLPVLNQMILY